MNQMKINGNIYETGARNLEGLSVDKLLALDDEAADIYDTIRKKNR